MSRNKKGQFEKGNGGRPKGSKNKAGADLRIKIENLVSENFDKLVTDIESLEASERVKTYLKLMEYVIPKKREVQQNIDFSELSDDEIDQLFERAVNSLPDER